jgi:hypothetical protein
MMADDWKQKQAEENERLVAEYLQRGGAVTQIPLGQRSEPSDPKSFWGGRPKKKPTAEDPTPVKTKPKAKPKKK